MSHMAPQNQELKILCPVDCGNAPRKSILKSFNIAFAQKDMPFIADQITDDVQWNIVGSFPAIHGKNEFLEALTQMNISKTIELQITNIVTHGNTAAMNGVIKLENDKSYAFCTMYVFSSASKQAKIKEMTSYVIEVS